MSLKRTGLLTALTFVLVITSWAQTTEFTYQGNLSTGTPPALTEVNHDFEFRLFSVDTGGSAISTLQRLNVPVSNGSFSVKLDFGAQFPANAPRYLEIAVRTTAGGGVFQTLSPRTRILSSPFSVRSKDANNADNATQLGGVAANQYLLTNGNGSSLTNLNAANITTGTLAVANGGTGSATKNFVDLSTDQNSIGGNKAFTGNTVSVQNDLFANTIDTNGLNVFGSGVVTGNLGVGTNSPAGKFHLNVPGSGTPIGALTVDVGTFGTGGNAINSYFFRARDLGLGGTPAFLIRGDGNVGIGSATPTSKLFVSGTGGVRANVNSDSNAGLGLSLNNAPGWSVATVSPGQFQIFNDAIGQNAVWINPANNNVGIGTSAPGAKLEVNGDVKVTGTITGPRTNMSLNTAAITPMGGLVTPIPGLSQTVNVSGNAKLLVEFSVSARTPSCTGCLASDVGIHVVLDGVAQRGIEQTIANNDSNVYISSSWLMPVAAGNHTVEIRGYTLSGPNVTFGCNNCGIFLSNLIVQVIPE